MRNTVLYKNDILICCRDYLQVCCLAGVLEQYGRLQCCCLHRWEAGEYDPCSKTCEGMKTRRVFCQGTTPSGTVFEEPDTNMCASEVSSKLMESIPCGVECADYQWITYSYSECSAVCGPGFQSRQVVCEKRMATSGMIVPDADCVAAEIGFKPATRKDCSSHCEYSAGPWNDCSVTCGNGRKTREVICIKRNPDGTQQTVANSDCDNDSTITSRHLATSSCNLGPCCKTVHGCCNK